MDKQYLTRSELTKRWTSWKLVERFFPTCSKTMRNPNCSSIQLYNTHQVRLIESTNLFKIELGKEKMRRAIQEYQKIMGKTKTK